jgi:hypothetical protein
LQLEEDRIADSKGALGSTLVSLALDTLLSSMKSRWTAAIMVERLVSMESNSRTEDSIDGDKPKCLGDRP